MIQSKTLSIKIPIQYEYDYNNEFIDFHIDISISYITEVIEESTIHVNILNIATAKKCDFYRLSL